MNIKSKIFAVSIGLATAIAHLGVAQAGPLNPAPVFKGDSNVVQVQNRRPRYRRPNNRRRYRNNRGAVAGAIIGGIIAGAVVNERRRNRRAYRRGSRHVRWCLNRYRSYDPRSNTYQPYRGGRRYCRSPYG